MITEQLLPHLTDFTAENWQAAGFTGNASTLDLRSNPRQVPDEMGVYAVIHDKTPMPSFLEVGTGGHFKNRNPNLPISDLKTNWVPDSTTVYIGKAGALSGRATLKTRLRQYIRFGEGSKVGHWGGRLIWQLAEHEQLRFLWMPTPDEEPREVEKRLIAAFEARFGQLPYANLTR